MPTTAFLTDLLATNAGKFIACNIIDAVEQNVLDKCKAKEAVVFCRDTYNTDYKNVADDGTRRKKTCTLFYKLFTTNSTLRFQAKYPADDVKHDKTVCWVTSFKALAGNYINFSKAAAHFVFNDDSDFTADSMKAALAALPSAETKPSAMMRGFFETWWHTNPETFEKIMTAVPATQAERARDWLGLIHIKKDAALVAITIPPEAIAGAGSVKRPTFVESGDHPRFRSWIDVTTPDWGRTVDLHALASARPDTMGGEERVASPIPFPALDRINARLLGIVSNTHEETQSDGTFMSLIMRGRSENVLRQELLQLVV